MRYENEWMKKGERERVSRRKLHKSATFVSHVDYNDDGKMWKL